MMNLLLTAFQTAVHAARAASKGDLDSAVANRDSNIKFLAWFFVIAVPAYFIAAHYQKKFYQREAQEEFDRQAAKEARMRPDAPGPPRFNG
jgi:hypothetical protein